MTTKHAMVLVVIVALGGALVATQVENCGLMDGGRHAAMSCPAAILPAPLILTLVALSLATIWPILFTPQFVLISRDHPPRHTGAR